MIICEIPPLLYENETIIQYWKILSTFDRQSGFSGIMPISSKSIRDFCFDYDLDWEIYELILVFEQSFIETYNKIQSEERKKKQKK